MIHTIQNYQATMNLLDSSVAEETSDNDRSIEDAVVTGGLSSKDFDFRERPRRRHEQGFAYRQQAQATPDLNKTPKNKLWLSVSNPCQVSFDARQRPAGCCRSRPSITTATHQRCHNHISFDGMYSYSRIHSPRETPWGTWPVSSSSTTSWIVSSLGEWNRVIRANVVELGGGHGGGGKNMVMPISLEAIPVGESSVWMRCLASMRARRLTLRYRRIPAAFIRRSLSWWESSAMRLAIAWDGTAKRIARSPRRS